MAKKKGHGHRLAPKPLDQHFRVSNVPVLHEDATTDPSASLEYPTSGIWGAADATNAPRLGEDEPRPSAYAQTAAALLDKYVLGRDFISFTLLVIGIGWIFLFDNANGKLATWEGLLWTVGKSCVLVLLFVGVLVLHWAYKKWLL